MYTYTCILLLLCFIYQSYTVYTILLIHVYIQPFQFSDIPKRSSPAVVKLLAAEDEKLTFAPTHKSRPLPVYTYDDILYMNRRSNSNSSQQGVMSE